MVTGECEKRLEKDQDIKLPVPLYPSVQEVTHHCSDAHNHIRTEVLNKPEELKTMNIGWFFDEKG